MKQTKSMEYLDYIRKALKGHRAWLQNPKTGKRADLSHFDLSELTLPGISLKAATLVGANLYKTNLKGADLSMVDLFAADMEGANLADVNLYGANLRGSCLNNATLDGANLTGCDFRSGQISTDTKHERSKRVDRNTGLTATDTQLRNSNLSRAILVDTRMQGVDLSGAEMDQADLRGADLSGAIVVGANIGEAIMETDGDRVTRLDGLVADVDAITALSDRGVEVAPPQTDLRGSLAELMSGHVAWIESDGRQGQRLSIENGLIDGADLRGADLRGARFARSSLKGVTFDAAHLTMTEFSRCTLDNTTFVEADLSGVTFKDCELTGTRFDKARLVAIPLGGDGPPWPASFRRSDMTNADLRTAIAEGLVFQRANLNTAKLSLGLLRVSTFHGCDLPRGVSEAKLRELQAQAGR